MVHWYGTIVLPTMSKTLEQAETPSLIDQVSKK